jgi:hypothetical protein
MGYQQAPQMAEVFGVPTYFVTHTIREDAGNGIVRSWNCELRNGVLIPHCEIIIAAERLAIIARQSLEWTSDRAIVELRSLAGDLRH